MVANMNMQEDRKVVYLPYDIINVIFDYLSQMTESGWILEVDNRGRVRLLLRPLFTGIHHINYFKQNVSARYVQLQLIFDHYTNQTVDALEQPYRIHSQARIEEYYQNGIISDCRCYKYLDQTTGLQMIAYVESHYNRETGTSSFQHGCLYDEQGNSYIVSGFGSNEQNVTIAVNTMNMVWDYTDDEINDIAEAFLDLEEYENENENEIEDEDEEVNDVAQALIDMFDNEEEFEDFDA